jgi:hypothetical protein
MGRDSFSGENLGRGPKEIEIYCSIRVNVNISCILQRGFELYVVKKVFTILREHNNMYM